MIKTISSASKKPAEYFLHLDTRVIWKVHNRQMFVWDRHDKKFRKIANTHMSDNIDVIRNSGEYIKIENTQEV